MGIRTDLAIESTKIEGGIPQKGVEIDQYRGESSLLPQWR